MANILSKTGIIPGTVVQASYVSQSIDAFTGIVPYNLSLNGNFNLIGVLDTTALSGGNGGSLTGSLSSTSSFAITSSYTNKINTPISWSLYATSASYSEGVLSTNVPVSQIPSLNPSIIIAGSGTILMDTNTYELYSTFFSGKTLNNNVWVALLQRGPYPSTNPNYGSTCVIPSGISGNVLTFNVLSGNASADLTFDFIITVQR
jgi:hypothetical protein